MCDDPITDPKFGYRYANRFDRKRYLASDPRCQTCGGSIPYKAEWHKRKFCSRRCMGPHLSQIKDQGLRKVCAGCGKLGRRAGAYCRPCMATHWTDADHQYVVEHYPLEGGVIVGKALGRPAGTVVYRANEYGIHLAEGVRKRLAHEVHSERMRENNPMQREEMREKMREWHKNNPQHKEAMLRGHRKLQRDKPSGLELRARQYLDDMGVTYEPSVALKSKFIVDIRIGNTIIELDGDYWHGHPRMEPLTERQQKQQARDRSRDKYLIACGYTVIRIWESDLTRDHLEALLREHGVIGTQSCNGSCASNPDPLAA